MASVILLAYNLTPLRTAESGSPARDDSISAPYVPYIELPGSCTTESQNSTTMTEKHAACTGIESPRRGMKRGRDEADGDCAYHLLCS